MYREKGFLKISSVSIPKSRKESFYVEIKREWRQHIIDYLKEKGISYRSLFNDLEGHIRYRSSYETLTKLKEDFLATFSGSKDYTEAIALLEKIVEHDQEEAVVCASLFLINYKEQKKNRGDFDKLVIENKRATMFYFLRSYFYEDAEWKYELKDHKRVTELQPNFYQVYFNRGRLYNKHDEHNLALDDYDKALELKPDYHKIYLNKGVLYQEQKKLYLALQNYSQAIKLKPYYFKAYYNRSFLYYQLGRFDLALKGYNQVLELKPDDHKVYNHRGALYVKLGEFDLALKDYGKALELKPDYDTARKNRERVLRKIQERDDKDKK